MLSDYDACLAAGCDDFITKPINKEQLFQAIYKNLKLIDEEIEKEKIVSDVFNKRNIKMKELIIKFVNSLPDNMKLLETLRENNSWTDMRSELHKLKGIGSSMGYPIITELAAGLDYEVMRENKSEIDALLFKLKNVCERIVKCIPDIMSESKE